MIAPGAVITPSAARRDCSRRAITSRQAGRPAAPARHRGRSDGRQPAPPPAAASAAALGALQLAGGAADQGRDRRHRQEALAPAVRRRQRRQHLVPHRAERGDLHADAVQQVRPHGRRPLHGRSRRQPARRRRGRARARSCCTSRSTRPCREAKGVVHCHPPHATAYAITGRVPPDGRHPRVRRVRRGRGACRPTRRRARRRFAETVLPYVQELQHGAAGQPRHRVLGRHGDARRVVRRGARDLLLDAACSRRSSARRSTASRRRRREDLLNIKKRLGLPDPRFHPGRVPAGRGPRSAHRRHRAACRPRRARCRQQGATAAPAATRRCGEHRARGDRRGHGRAGGAGPSPVKAAAATDPDSRTARGTRVRRPGDAVPRARELGVHASAATSSSSNRQKVLKRVHGGALAMQPRGHLLDYDWQRERQSRREAPHRRSAPPSLIEDDQTVILDGGIDRRVRGRAPREPVAARHHQLAWPSRRCCGTRATSRSR